MVYIHAIMLAISEFKQLKQRLPEPNDDNELSILAKKHLDELKSKDVCLHL